VLGHLLRRCAKAHLQADAGLPMGSFVAFLLASTLDTWRGMTRLLVGPHLSHCRLSAPTQSPISGAAS